MLNIPEELINDFSNGTSTKQVEVELEGYDCPQEELNYFISDGSDREWKATERKSSTFDYIHFYENKIDEMTGSPNYTQPLYADFGNKTMYIGMDIYFEKFPSAAINENAFRFCMDYWDFTSYEALLDNYTKAQLRAATRDNPIRIRFPYSLHNGSRMQQVYFYLVDSNGNKLDYKLWYKNVSITESMDTPYHHSMVIKGQLPPEKRVITNENIEKDQMSLTESLCSADNLLFGSAEASCINIGVVDTREDFNNRYIRPSFVRQITDPSQYNFDDINWSSADTDIEFLQKYGNSDRNYVVGRTVDMSVYNVISTSNAWREYAEYALGIEYGMRVLFKTIGFTGDTPPKKLVIQMLYRHTEGGAILSSDYVYNIGADGAWVDETFSFFKPFNAPDSVYKLTGARYYFADIDGNPVAENYGVYDEFSIFVLNVGIYLHTTDKKDTPFVRSHQYYAYGADIEKVLKDKQVIPLGRFKVDQVQKTVTHTLTKKNITAYDDCYNLEQNASDWYTFYMFGVNSYQYSSAYGFEFARQIYSSYFNIARQLGIEKIDYENEQEILRYEESEGTAISRFAGSFSRQFNNGSTGACYLHYTKSTITGVDSNYLYRVRMEHKNFMDDRSIVQFELGSKFQDFNNDPYGRGFTKKGSICVVEYDSGNVIINKYLVDSDDYFKVSDNCSKFDVYVPYGWNQNATSSSGLHNYVNRVFVYRLYKPFKLTNASTRLVYYRYYKTKGIEDIFACDSSISARDVLRSLLEPTGCFYHLDRYGQPKFIYCTKSGLYPSNTLYPADDLYPRAGADGQLLALSKYITFVADDYVVRNIGRIQILKDTYSNESKSVCEWEYIGDRNNDNTYIIDDNIFYCNEEMVYEYDAMPEVATMLENLYHDISNLGYVPNTTVTYGMPWTEVGDRIGLLTEDGGLESFLFRRTMNGIQKIRDTFESKGDEYTKPINNYSYKAY